MWTFYIILKFVLKLFHDSSRAWAFCSYPSFRVSVTPLSCLSNIILHYLLKNKVKYWLCLDQSKLYATEGCNVVSPHLESHIVNDSIDTIVFLHCFSAFKKAAVSLESTLSLNSALPSFPQLLGSIRFTGAPLFMLFFPIYRQFEEEEASELVIGGRWIKKLNPL